MKTLALAIQRQFLGFDGRIQSLSERLPLSDALAPIFLVGPPRSGSTLLYQFLVCHFEVTYLSNLMALCPRYMRSIARLTGSRMRSYSEIRPSHYGFVPGLFSPNEGGAVLRHWFEELTTEHERTAVYNTVASISAQQSRPMVFKNLNNSFRLETIQRIFPNAKFVLVTRDPVHVAQSLLLARRRNLGSDAPWFGPQPPGWEAVVSESPHYQVAWQAVEIERLIRLFFAERGQAYLEISFEEFCADPALAKRTIASELKIQPKNNLKISGIEFRQRVEVSEKDWTGLVDAVSSVVNNRSQENKCSVSTS